MNDQFETNKKLFATSITQKHDRSFLVALGTQGEFIQNDEAEILIMEYNPQSGFKQRSQIRHGPVPIQLQFLDAPKNNNQLLLSAGAKLRLYSYSPPNMRIKLEQEFSSPSVRYSGAVTAYDVYVYDQRKVVCGHIDNSVCVWDIGAQQMVFQSLPHTKEVRSVSYSYNEKCFATLGADRFLGIVDTNQPQHLKVVSKNLQLNYHQVAWDLADQQFISVTDYDSGYIDIYDVRQMRLKYDKVRLHFGGISKIAYLYPTKYLISSGDDGNMFLCKDFHTCRPIKCEDEEKLQILDFGYVENITSTQYQSFSFCYTTERGCKIKVFDEQKLPNDQN